MSGGGPPTLISLTESEAKKKYVFDVPNWLCLSCRKLDDKLLRNL